MDSNTSRSRPPRSTLTRWVSPDADSSWAALGVTTAIWSVLAVFWILYLALADVELYRLVLYPVLALVAVLQVLSNIAAIKKKRARSAGTKGPDWYRN